MKKEGLIEIGQNHEVIVLDPEALDRVIESNKIKTCTNCMSDVKKIVTSNK